MEVLKEKADAEHIFPSKKFFRKLADSFLNPLGFGVFATSVLLVIHLKLETFVFCEESILWMWYVCALESDCGHIVVYVDVSGLSI